ncbi:hypothetical protein MMC25_008106 [Agyrium rufum]|nr:hypothetical protein [Agyrium rufum]
MDVQYSPTSPRHSAQLPTRISFSRRSSTYSAQYSPITPRPQSSHSQSGEYGFSNGFGYHANTGEDDGLGSLADELAEAWDEDGEGDIVQEQQLHSQMEIHGGEDNIDAMVGDTLRKTEDNNELANAQLPTRLSGLGIQATPGLQIPASKHPSRRTAGADYDGSEYGSSSDLEEANGISASLESRMSAIEGLARLGTGYVDVSEANIITQVTESLRDLSSQMDVESRTTRLSTTHQALTTHLGHATRLLTSLAHPLLLPQAFTPTPYIAMQTLLPSHNLPSPERDANTQEKEVSDEDIDIPSLLTILLSFLPQAPSTPLLSLHSLSQSTDSLLGTLSALSDTLHMLRQTQSLAARRLKSAKEIVETLRREVEVQETGRKWIEEGRWEDRLRDREAKKICDGVVGGFEEVCRGWRERLAIQGGWEIEVGAG